MHGPVGGEDDGTHGHVARVEAPFREHQRPVHGPVHRRVGARPTGPARAEHRAAVVAPHTSDEAYRAGREWVEGLRGR